MKNIIFNPIYNKNPQGAVKNNQKINFNMLVKEDFYFKKISIILINDETKFEIEKDLSIISKNKNYNTLSVELDCLNSGLYFYYFKIVFDDLVAYVKNNKLNAVTTTNYNEFELWQLTVYDKSFKTPDWFKGTIMYQIFPDRFKKSENFTQLEIPKNDKERFIHKNWTDTPHSSITHKNYQAKDFFKGNLKGIEEEKEYFKNLNIESIYLNPIVESAENHRYSTADYFKVDPYFATNEQFESFCKDFKKNNIKIILDGVFSHTGSDSIYFNKYNNYNSVGAYNSINSPYYDWFDFKEFPNNYNSWWGFDNLPTVNKYNKTFLKFITEKDNGVLNYWQKLGISGWRLDVADEFPDEFLDAIRDSVKSYDNEAIIIGEVWEDASNKMAYNKRRRYFQGAQLDSVMNYPWREAIINFVKYKNSEEFEYNINQLIENYPKEALDSLMNLISSHDMPRILTALAVDNAKEYPLNERLTFNMTENLYNKVKILSKFVAFIQFTLPGVPSIYYGDEIGMYGFTDPYNRLCFDRDNIDYDLLNFYKNLTKFRYDYKQSFKNNFEFLYSKNGCVAYKRNNIICVINMNEKPIILDIVTNGEILFTNKDCIFTKYGLVVPSETYLAIKV